MPRGLAKKTEELIEAAYDICKERQPITVRGICYVLFETYGLIPDMSKKSTNRISVALRNARESGMIPWEWIVDGSRSNKRYNTGGWDEPDAYLAAVSAVKNYRRDYWETQPVFLEIWSEKETVAGVVEPVLEYWGVNFKNFRGFNSATNVHDEAERSTWLSKPIVALYIGDYDPSGLFMSEVDLPQRIERYGGDIKIRSIALTKADTIGRPGNDVETKSGDRRIKWWHENGFGPEFWELDGLDPRVLRDRVATAIQEYVNIRAWKQCQSTEQAEQNSLRLFFEKIDPIRRAHFNKG